jgi:hypothetical protein
MLDFDVDFDDVEGVTIDDNSVDSRYYTDVGFTWGPDRDDSNWELFFNVQNLFDKDPRPAALFAEFKRHGAGRAARAREPSFVKKVSRDRAVHDAEHQSQSVRIGREQGDVRMTYQVWSGIVAANRRLAPGRQQHRIVPQ